MDKETIETIIKIFEEIDMDNNINESLIDNENVEELSDDYVDGVRVGAEIIHRSLITSLKIMMVLMDDFEDLDL